MAALRSFQREGFLAEAFRQPTVRTIQEYSQAPCQLAEQERGHGGAWNAASQRCSGHSRAAEVNREAQGEGVRLGGRRCHTCLGLSQETPFWLGCLGGRQGKSDQPETPRVSRPVSSGNG